jgi:hypothetical protein
MIQYKKGNDTYNGVYIEVDGVRIINPTEETLKANGYEQVETETAEQLLQDAKDRKLAELDVFNQSSEVNDFTFKGMHTWLTPSERASYNVSIAAAEALGETTITFAIAEQPLTIDIPTAKIVLAKIQRYADATFMVTVKNKAAITALSSIEEVNAYDFTKGYPEKLQL